MNVSTSLIIYGDDCGWVMSQNVSLSRSHFTTQPKNFFSGIETNVSNPNYTTGAYITFTFKITNKK